MLHREKIMSGMTGRLQRKKRAYNTSVPVRRSYTLKAASSFLVPNCVLMSCSSSSSNSLASSLESFFSASAFFRRVFAWERYKDKPKPKIEGGRDGGRPPRDQETCSGYT